MKEGCERSARTPEKKSYSLLVGVPETLSVDSYFWVVVSAADEEEARRLALDPSKHDDSGFIGFSLRHSKDYTEPSWEDAQVEKVLPWKFEPGQMVSVKPEGLEAKILWLVENFGRPCGVCGLGVTPPLEKPMYMVEFTTGAWELVEEDRLAPLGR